MDGTMAGSTEVVSMSAACSMSTSFASVTLPFVLLVGISTLLGYPTYPPKHKITNHQHATR